MVIVIRGVWNGGMVEPEREMGGSERRQALCSCGEKVGLILGTGGHPEKSSEGFDLGSEITLSHLPRGLASPPGPDHRPLLRRNWRPGLGPRPPEGHPDLSPP